MRRSGSAGRGDKSIGGKFETRNPKFETNSKSLKERKTKWARSSFFCNFRSFENCFGFRVSDFGFSQELMDRIDRLDRPVAHRKVSIAFHWQSARVLPSTEWLTQLLPQTARSTHSN